MSRILPAGALALFTVLVMVLAGSVIIGETDGDGGFIPVDDFPVYEPAQNAILCWNGTHEKMVLSITINSVEATEGLHVVPFPSRPEVELGDIQSFQRLEDVFDGRLKSYGGWGYGQGGEGNDASGYGNGTGIEYQRTIGNHEVTVIRSTDADDFRNSIEEILDDIGISLERWPDGMDELIGRYIQRDFNYFCIDHFGIMKDEGSVEPLIYTFETDKVVFPLEISSILEGYTGIHLGIMVPEDLPVDTFTDDLKGKVKKEGLLTRGDVFLVEPDLASMFSGDCLGIYCSWGAELSELRGDLILERMDRAAWMRTSTSHRRMDLYQGPDRISGLLLFEDHVYMGSGLIRLIDERSGDDIWSSYPVELHDGDHSNRMVLLDDLDGDGADDIIIGDAINSSSLIVSRLDPETGDILWQTGINDNRWYYRYGKEPYIMRSHNGDRYAVFFGFQGYRTGIDRIFMMNVETGSGQTVIPEKGDDVDSIRKLLGPDGDRLLFGDQYLYDPFSGSNGKFTHSDLQVEDVVTYSGESRLILYEDGWTIMNTTHPYEKRKMEGRPIEVFETEDGRVYGYLKDQSWLKRTDMETLQWDWSMGFGYDSRYDSIELIDLDGGGESEIILYQEQNPNHHSDHESTYINSMVIDGEDGRLVFEDNSYFLAAGGDMDDDGYKEVLVNELGDIRAVEPHGGEYTASLGKGYDFYGRVVPVCPYWKDVTGDGYQDIVVKYPRYGYHYSYILGYRVVIYDGYTKSTIEDTDSDDWGYYIDVIPDSDIAGRMMMRAGTRIYSMNTANTIKLESSNERVYSGEMARLYAFIRNDDGYVRGAYISWSSDVEDCRFSSTTEIMPGIYSVDFWAPQDYNGEVRVEMEVLYPRLGSERAKITLEVMNGTSGQGPPPEEEEVVEPPCPQVVEKVEIIAVSPPFEINMTSSISIRLHTSLDQRSLKVDMKDLFEEVSYEFILKEGDIWTTSYEPTGKYGPRNVEITVMERNVTYRVEKRRWYVNPSREQEETSPFTMSLYPYRARPGEPVTVFISTGISELDGELMFEGNDDNNGGTFSPFYNIADGLWTSTYMVPDTEGSVPIEVMVLLDGGLFQIMEEDLEILHEGPDQEPMVVVHELVRRGAPQDDVLDLYIAAYRGDDMVEELDHVLIMVPQGLLIMDQDPTESSSLRLSIVQEEGASGTLELMVTDGYSDWSTVEVSIPEMKTDEATGEGPDKGETPSSTDDGGPDNGDDTGATEIGIIVALSVGFGVALVLILMTFRVLDKKRYGS